MDPNDSQTSESVDIEASAAAHQTSGNSAQLLHESRSRFDRKGSSTAGPVRVDVETSESNSVKSNRVQTSLARARRVLSRPRRGNAGDNANTAAIPDNDTPDAALNGGAGSSAAAAVKAKAEQTAQKAASTALQSTGVPKVAADQLARKGTARAKKKLRRWIRVLAILLTFALILVVGALAPYGAASGGYQPDITEAGEADVAGVDPEIMNAYIAAGKKFGIPWTVLAGVGKVATDHGRRDPFNPDWEEGQPLGREGGPQGIFMINSNDPAAPENPNDIEQAALWLASQIAEGTEQILDEELPAEVDPNTAEGSDIVLATVLARLPLAVQGGYGLQGGSVEPGAVNRLLVVGDSLTVGAETAGLVESLVASGFPTPVVDARVGRPISEGIDVLTALSPRAGDLVIFALGTNDSPSEERINSVAQELMSVANGAYIMWVNVDLPSWAAANAALLEVSEQWPNLTVADWAAEAAVNPGWRASDGIHYSNVGYAERAQFYSDAAVNFIANGNWSTAPTLAAPSPGSTSDISVNVAVPPGCPVSLPVNGIRNGTTDIGQLCALSMTQAGSPEAAQAVRFAMAAVGTPYSQPRRNNVGWFDCSSLVTRAYQSAGVPIAAAEMNAPTTHSMLPRDGWQRAPWSEPISAAEARPGDLVFPHEGHVAMVLADGWVVHAPATGDFVHIRPMYANPLAFRRVNVPVAEANPWGGPQYADASGADQVLPEWDTSSFQAAAGSNHAALLWARTYGGTVRNDDRPVPEMANSFQPLGAFSGDEADVVNIIREIFPPEQVRTAVEIARAESGLDPNVNNEGMNRNQSIDWGLFQLNDGTPSGRARCETEYALCYGTGTLQELYNEALSADSPEAQASRYIHAGNTPVVSSLSELQQLALNPQWNTLAAAQLWSEQGGGRQGWAPWCSASEVLGINDVC